VCVFDPGQAWRVDVKALKSQGRNTPFIGLEMEGRVSYTLVEGHVVHEPQG
jgi:dihydroorotase